MAKQSTIRLQKNTHSKKSKPSKYDQETYDAYLRFSQMALTLRTLLGIAEPVPRNNSSGYTSASVASNNNKHKESVLLQQQQQQQRQQQA